MRPLRFLFFPAGGVRIIFCAALVSEGDSISPNQAWTKLGEKKGLAQYAPVVLGADSEWSRGAFGSVHVVDTTPTRNVVQLLGYWTTADDVGPVPRVGLPRAHRLDAPRFEARESSWTYTPAGSYWPISVAPSSWSTAGPARRTFARASTARRGVYGTSVDVWAFGCVCLRRSAVRGRHAGRSDVAHHPDSGDGDGRRHRAHADAPPRDHRPFRRGLRRRRQAVVQGVHAARMHLVRRGLRAGPGRVLTMEPVESHLGARPQSPPRLAPGKKTYPQVGKIGPNEMPLPRADCDRVDSVDLVAATGGAVSTSGDDLTDMRPTASSTASSCASATLDALMPLAASTTCAPTRLPSPTNGLSRNDDEEHAEQQGDDVRYDEQKRDGVLHAEHAIRGYHGWEVNGW